MLSKPENGWTDFSLGDINLCLSYVTNVPLEWLDQAIHGLETLQPFAVRGYLEPGRMLCLVSYWNCHIIIEDDENKDDIKMSDVHYEIANVNMLDFCKILYSDLLNDIDSWCYWDETRPIDYKTIKNKLDRLENLIKEKEKGKYFDRNTGVWVLF